MATYLPPVEKPKGLVLRAVYFFTRRQFGRVATPIAVFSARMPTAFLTFAAKMSRLDRKLKLPEQTVAVVREQVASINTCLFCMDVARWYATRKSRENAGRFDALGEYQTSALFSEAERAALDYATELTRDREVHPNTFDRLAAYYSEREICDLVWVIASEHLYNMTNIGLNIGSDGLCDVHPRQLAHARRSTATAIGSGDAS
jgi:alkylhydroperoxidase family enzyme